MSVMSLEWQKGTDDLFLAPTPIPEFMLIFLDYAHSHTISHKRDVPNEIFLLTLHPDRAAGAIMPTPLAVYQKLI